MLARAQAARQAAEAQLAEAEEATRALIDAATHNPLPPPIGLSVSAPNLAGHLSHQPSWRRHPQDAGDGARSPRGEAMALLSALGTDSAAVPAGGVIVPYMPAQLGPLSARGRRQVWMAQDASLAQHATGGAHYRPSTTPVSPAAPNLGGSGMVCEVVAPPREFESHMQLLEATAEFGPPEFTRMGPNDLRNGLALMKLQQMDGIRGEVAGSKAHAPQPVVTKRVPLTAQQRGLPSTSVV